MSNITVTFQIPEEKQAAVLAAVSSVLKPDEEKPHPASGPAAWDPDLTAQAIAGVKGVPERRLLRRLAEAWGQRVPMSELSRDLGLPSAPSLEHDFSELQAFCAEDPSSRPFPVLTGGADGDGWYGMAWIDANSFFHAFHDLDPRGR